MEDAAHAGVEKATMEARAGTGTGVEEAALEAPAGNGKSAGTGVEKTALEARAQWTPCLDPVPARREAVLRIVEQSRRLRSAANASAPASRRACGWNCP